MFFDAARRCKAQWLSTPLVSATLPLGTPALIFIYTPDSLLIPICLGFLLPPLHPSLTLPPRPTNPSQLIPPLPSSLALTFMRRLERVQTSSLSKFACIATLRGRSAAIVLLLLFVPYAFMITYLVLFCLHKFRQSCFHPFFPQLQALLRHGRSFSLIQHSLIARMLSPR